MSLAKQRWRLLGVVMGLLYAVSTASAQAALIEADHPAFGTNSLTVDTDSNLAWLDLTFSTGLSFVEANSQTGPGGQFEGFRSATDFDVYELFQAAGIPNINASDFDFSAANENISAAQALILLIGQTSSQDGHPEALGFLVTGSRYTPGSRYKAEIDFFYGNGIPGYVVGPYGGAYNENVGYSSIGTFLVQTIPEPATLMLAMLAGAGALLRRERFRGAC